MARQQEVPGAFSDRRGGIQLLIESLEPFTGDSSLSKRTSVPPANEGEVTPELRNLAKLVIGGIQIIGFHNAWAAASRVCSLGARFSKGPGRGGSGHPGAARGPGPPQRARRKCFSRVSKHAPAGTPGRIDPVANGDRKCRVASHRVHSRVDRAYCSNEP